MQIVPFTLIFLGVLKHSKSLEPIWHPYHHDPHHHVREELLIANLTSDDRFNLDHHVTRWYSLPMERTSYVVGLMDENLLVASLKQQKNFTQESYVIELQGRPVDVQLMEYWNSTLKKSQAVLVVAVQKNLLWFLLQDTDYSQFWSWPLAKTISHINIFQINYNHHLLAVTTLSNRTTADLYEFDLEQTPDFWLKQQIPLQQPSTSSAFITNGPHYLFAIPQPSLDSLLVFKLGNSHFQHFRNLSSEGVDQVVSFKVGPKAFLAFNGLEAGVHRLGKTDLVKEDIVNSHLDGVNYWLPMHTFQNKDSIILIAQRSLDHGFHHSFVVEVITYDGTKFEEHEDVRCSYFGVEVLGLSCLPGEESERGIIGATPVYVDGVLELLVPRDGNFSELFMVNTEVREIPNPVHKQVEEFLRQKQVLSDVMEVQEKRHKEMTTRLKDVDSSRHRLEEMSERINSMKEALRMLDEGHYDTVTFTAPVQVTEIVVDEVQVDTIEEVPADEVFADIVMRNNMKTIPSPKTFNTLEVESLFAAKINQADTDDLLFTTSDNITISGDVIIEGTLDVAGHITAQMVNEKVLEKDIVHLDSHVEKLAFEEVVVRGDVAADKLDNYSLPTLDSLFIPHNLRVENINGENLDQFLRQLCLKNVKSYIPGTTKIHGDVLVRGEAQTTYLNHLKFPDEYVFVHNSSPNITGKKYFTNTLRTSELKTDGTIDGIDTSQIITLTTDQDIPNKTTFQNLKVTESLKVDGQVLGEDASKFLPNPTLLQEKLIHANLHFHNLTVEGNIIVTGDFNGHDFHALLSDVVYKNEDEAVIEAVKQFPEGFKVSGDMSIISNSINDFDINSVVTKDTEQVLNITRLKGIADFGTIDVTGLYDFVDIHKLDEDVVKLDGEQYISATIIFEDELRMGKLDVVETINELEEDEVVTSIQDMDTIEADQIVIEGNLWGEIEDFDLDDFVKTRLSLVEDQEIKTDYTITELSVDFLQTEKMNGEPFYQLTAESFEDEVRKKLRTSKLTVKDLYVQGPLEIDRINNQSTVNLGNSMWKNLEKYNLTNLTFYDDIHFTTLDIGELSGVKFDKFVKNLVFKNETNPVIRGVKTFTEGITVINLITTEKLNDIPLTNLLTRQGVQQVQGPLVIHGNVSLDSVTITDTINDMPIHTITDIYTSDNNHYEIKADVLFNGLQHIHNLNMEGLVNDIPSKEVISGIVYKNKDVKIGGLTTFTNQVLIEKNIIVNTTNNIDLAAFAASLVMVTKDTDIWAPIRFKEAVTVEKQVTASNNLETKLLMGVDTNTWTQDAIFINKGLLNGMFNFEEVEIIGNLQTDYLNDVKMDTLVLLRSPQNLSKLSFEKVTTYNDIRVGNSTNYYDLRSEYNNTVLVDSVQDIDSDLEFGGEVFIAGSVELHGLLNGMPVDKVVTTNTDQDLEAVYNFGSKVILEKDLKVRDLVNGINITQWLSEGVKIKSDILQNITEDWLITDQLILEDDVTGNGLINGLDLRKFQQEVEEKRKYKYAVERGLIEDYGNICKDLTYMHQRLKKQIYKFNYLESLQELNFKNRIRTVYHFNRGNNIYLLVNEEKSCESHLFLFDGKFHFVRSLNLGLVSQIITVRDFDFIYLVTRSETLRFCDLEGTNVWQLQDQAHFQHLMTMQNQDLLQESLVPATFYGLKDHTVTEFKILPYLEPRLKKYRKWEVNPVDNIAFVPRGLATGLALRTGKKLIQLHRNERVDNTFNHDLENIIVGNHTEEPNAHLPGRDADLIVLKVAGKRTLVAVASHEETSIKGSLDFVKIYEDAISGKVFHKVPTYKPSSLIALELNNSETLFAFMEDERVLQVYEYKGIEGFRHKLAVRVEGSQLVALPAPKKLLGVVDGNRLTFLEAVMLGNKVDDDLECHL